MSDSLLQEIDYEYDGDLCVKEIQTDYHDGDKNVSIKHIEHDSHGHEIKWTIYDEDGKWVKLTSYDADGNVINSFEID